MYWNIVHSISFDMLYNSHKTRTLDTGTSLKKDFNENTTFALYFSFVKILNLQNLKIAADPLNIGSFTRYYILYTLLF